eukprot:TRINITY_DN4405_c0_g1_i17.p2 TRINITY_DN4405_c0_g1~~TRINITY_DN4405_c0_g1_i17.p2  ORF type:complete len:108 (-),score=16.44 TRINITY_DN4405_c0_g1_i17:1039-1362(-)
MPHNNHVYLFPGVSKTNIFHVWLAEPRRSFPIPSFLNKSSFPRIWKTEFPNLRVTKTVKLDYCDMYSRLDIGVKDVATAKSQKLLRKEKVCHLEKFHTERKFLLDIS